MPRTVERTPVSAGVQLPPALLEKLAPLAALADVEQLLDVAADLATDLPLFAAHVRRLALQVAGVRDVVRSRLGPAPFSRLPARYSVTAAGLDALTDPEANDVADECPATLSLELVPRDVAAAAVTVAHAARVRHDQLPHSVRAADTSRGFACASAFHSVCHYPQTCARFGACALERRRGAGGVLEYPAIPADASPRQESEAEQAARMRRDGFELVSDPASGGLPMWKLVRGPMLESLERFRAGAGEKHALPPAVDFANGDRLEVRE